MSSKLLTLKEIAEYLKLNEKEVALLVDQKVIPAYSLGGELLRFRKEQVDAVRQEIYSRIGRTEDGEEKKRRKKLIMGFGILQKQEGQSLVLDRISDFFYFNDFYIISAFLILILLIIIFCG